MLSALVQPRLQAIAYSSYHQKTQEETAVMQ